MFALSKTGTRQSTNAPPKALVLPTLHSRSSSAHDQQPQSSSSRVTPFQRKLWGLRDILLFPRAAYPAAIFFNLILRFTWSFKLSPHLHRNTDGALLIFYFELAELLRRWVWVFFRVEWETVKKMEGDRDAELFELRDDPEDSLGSP